MKLIIILSGLILLSGCTPQIEYVEVPPETVTPPAVTITAPPVTETVTIVTPPVTEYVEVIRDVEKIVTVNQTVEVFTDNISEWIIPWESQDEVRQYYKSVEVDLVEAMNSTPYRADCDDWARWLSHRALIDRKEIGLYALVNNEWQRTKGHLKNFVIIGNYLYELEPQNGNLVPLGGYAYTLD